MLRILISVPPEHVRLQITAGEIKEQQSVFIVVNRIFKQRQPFFHHHRGLSAEFIVIENAIGSGGINTIVGNELSNKLYGLAGPDSLLGSLGDDFLVGGSGNDKIYGGADNDLLMGGAGVDYVVAGDGDDQLIGGDQADYLLGGNGNDHLFGGDRADRLLGENGNDTLVGGIQSGAKRDVLEGGAGDDRFIGQDQDYFIGGRGNDVFEFAFAVTYYGSIADFTSHADNSDKLVFDHKVFSALLPGRLEDFQLQVGKPHEARTPDVRLFLVANSNYLYYDPDGNGPEKPELIVQLDNFSKLTVMDILIV